jgi:glycosyltransferase involved in cell wall biosynthesis
MNKIKVMHIITRMVRGGADENTAFTVQMLDKEIYEVDLFAGKGSEVEGFSNLKVEVLPHLVRQINPYHDLLAFFELYFVMKKGKYDIVHTHTAKAGILGRIAAYFCKVPVIIHTLHGSTFHDGLDLISKNVYIVLERICAKITYKIISVGDDLIDRYLKKGIGNKDKYITLRSGMYLDKFYRSSQWSDEDLSRIRNEIGIKNDIAVVTQIARLEKRKGYNYFVEAANKILKKLPDTIFLIVGEGEYKSKIEEMITKANLSSNFIFLGFRSDIEKVIAISNVIVLTSLWEGLPRILVQSAAVGRPIVTFAVEGATEVVKDDINGYVVKIGNIDALSEKVIGLLQDPDKRKSMGEKGRSIVGHDWDVGVMVKKIDEVYQQALNNPR